jgi:hypothetical protein
MLNVDKMFICLYLLKEILLKELPLRRPQTPFYKEKIFLVVKDNYLLNSNNLLFEC